MNIVNNANGLNPAIRTPEVRANAEYADRAFTKLLTQMSKKGYSYDGEQYFIDSNGTRQYDNLGNKVKQQTTMDKIYDDNVAAFDTPLTPAVHTGTASHQFIAPPVQQAPPQITIEAIVHQFKVYDPIQQQILLTILNQ